MSLKYKVKLISSPYYGLQDCLNGEYNAKIEGSMYYIEGGEFSNEYFMEGKWYGFKASEVEVLEILTDRGEGNE